LKNDITENLGLKNLSFIAKIAATIVWRYSIEVSQKIQALDTPGSRGLLPTPSPLRTGHDSFPSHGSSPSKANPCYEVTR
jgi:hypothetical protein